ncbi:MULTISPECIES: hypothetical protein [unclassified Francisella]|uniref:hypothetical protein n=1 Tax=unclassified Francisella TaxID=2610885 RepID=UPI002E2FF2FE|nr:MULTISPECIES: hypothetical protein [unclassified Francisella]MED7818871.1 hypothetical protein [Francisella sp. 19S2-4]MED7829674.1 hypothetical protein [Francisella sp. 19S2-10]
MLIRAAKLTENIIINPPNIHTIAFPNIDKEARKPSISPCLSSGAISESITSCKLLAVPNASPRRANYKITK